ncbi:MAG: NUDIX domain-containing protein [Fimbriimonadaceae bacterium]
MSKKQLIRPAAYTLVIRDQSLLLCRMCLPEPNNGRWTLPGGGLDFGESPTKGAVRETFEEAGINVKLGELAEIQSQHFVYPDKEMHALRFVYRVESWTGEIRDEADGSTDTCDFIPLELAMSGAAHPKYGLIRMVPLARRGFELAFGTRLKRPGS